MISRQQWIGFAAAAVVVAVYSVPTLANVQTWSFNRATQSFNSTDDGNTLGLTSSDDIRLTVTGWSDTNDIDTDYPNHATDIETPGSEDEFDMLLLEFDTAVNLEGIDLAWALGGNASDTADVSILPWNGSGSTAQSANTWAGVLAGDYDSVGD